MKNKIYYLETSTGKYPVVFNLNVMEEIQQEYGTMSKWGEAVEPEKGQEPSVKDLKAGFLAMINEGIDMENENNHENRPLMTSKQLGRLITDVGFNKIVGIIKDITTESTENDNQSKNE